MIIKICKTCKKEYKIDSHSRKTSKFCSPICYHKWLKGKFLKENNKGYKSITKKCEMCGKSFEVMPYRIKKGGGKFCSSKCYHKSTIGNWSGKNNPNWKEKIDKICEECKTKYTIHPYETDRSRFCSNKCKYKWMSDNQCGKNHPNWNGGIKHSYCEKWTIKFRNRIRAFFNYTCIRCGYKQSNKLLHCHHVYYDKKACCITKNNVYYTNLGITNNPPTFKIKGNPNKFALLCQKCHAKTTPIKNRVYWAKYYEDLINNKYNGKSYYTNEDFNDKH